MSGPTLYLVLGIVWCVGWIVGFLTCEAIYRWHAPR